jgi:hypothetical protein
VDAVPDLAQRGDVHGDLLGQIAREALDLQLVQAGDQDRIEILDGQRKAGELDPDGRPDPLGHIHGQEVDVQERTLDEIALLLAHQGRKFPAVQLDRYQAGGTNLG